MILTHLKIKIAARWQAECGYQKVLALAIPLVIGTASWSVQHFVDRMFLTWYSPEAIAAAMPAGMLNFTVMSLFMGTAIYVSTFIAQYHGSGQLKKIGPILWQGIYISIVAGIVLFILMPMSRQIFDFIGHEQAVKENEIIYFKILCLGAMPQVASSAMSGFFAGRGKTMTVMWLNISATVVNLFFDYILIFGKFGFPALGIKGAAIATVISACFLFIASALLIMKPSYNALYNTVSGWKFNTKLFSRLIKFGLPSGVQFFVDIAGFTFFILFIGRLGTTNLAATNIAFNINMLAFMPMIGFGMAISVLVGQNLGKNNPQLAAYSVYSGFHLTFIYMTTIALLYILVPDIFLAPFAAQAEHASFEEIRKISRILLRFVAVYSIFDALNIVFASAIKGAGDTRFVMIMILILTLVILIIPTYIVIFILEQDIYAGWFCATTYVILLGFAFLFRFLSGKWKSMRVIDYANEPTL